TRAAPMGRAPRAAGRRRRADSRGRPSSCALPIEGNGPDGAVVRGFAVLFHGRETGLELFSHFLNEQALLMTAIASQRDFLLIKRPRITDERGQFILKTRLIALRLGKGHALALDTFLEQKT